MIPLLAEDGLDILYAEGGINILYAEGVLSPIITGPLTTSTADAVRTTTSTTLDRTMVDAL